VRKKREKYGKKVGGNISLSFPVPVHDFRWCNFWWRSSTRSPTNTTGMVHIYYSDQCNKIDYNCCSCLYLLPWQYCKYLKWVTNWALFNLLLTALYCSLQYSIYIYGDTKQRKTVEELAL
jgi:hypothetical protein